MTPEMLNRLNPFRDETLKRGIPSADVERWISATARPCATLSLDGEGPVVGQFGGPLALPGDVPDPWFPLVAAIDCAAIPGEATDFLLPPDGQLLLFGFPDADDPYSPGGGSAVYIPSGTAVKEREERPWFREHLEMREIRDQFPQGQLRFAMNISLPYYGLTEIPEHPYTKPLPGHPYSGQLAETWSDTAGAIAEWGPLQIGGYATDEIQGASEPLLSSPVENPEGWALLADWYSGREGATIHWGIRRDDATARRFDQVRASVFWNP
jgi:hypothetical protein